LTPPGAGGQSRRAAGDRCVSTRASARARGPVRKNRRSIPAPAGICNGRGGDRRVGLMATEQLSRLIPAMRAGTLQHDEAARTDGQLLERYVRDRDEAAFAALVQRLGPMVWGVCRRVLRGHQDAEDAFQATFLVLVRKAGCVAPRGLVGRWLHSVALN